MVLIELYLKLIMKVLFLDTIDSANQTIRPVENSKNDRESPAKEESPQSTSERNTQNSNQNGGVHPSRLNTQTRRDLADLESVYRNFTTLNDSGVNTLIKTTSANTSAGQSNLNQRNESFNATRQTENESVANNSLKTSESNFGLQTINAIRTGNLNDVLILITIHLFIVGSVY
jgi:hypothetical protein